METVALRDRGEIEAFLRRDTFLHIYGLGDLDDANWPQTRWYGVKENGQIQAIALLYTALTTPALLALGDGRELPLLGELLRAISVDLPLRFHVHLGLGLSAALQDRYVFKSHGPHYKMALTDRSRPGRIDTSQVVPLSRADLDDLLELYSAGYPDAAFEPSMLDGKPCFGVRVSGRLISAGGVHVCSRQYRVAAPGNIVTHPAHRGKAYGKAVTARLCTELMKVDDHIGLNVKAANAAAVRCYRQVGFQVAGEYEEGLMAAVE